MPPKIVGQVLRAAVEFPASSNLERLGIEDKDTARAFTIGGPDGVDINAIRPAMGRMWTRIASALYHRFRLNDLDDLRIPWIRLGINNVNSRRAQPRDH